ncbi:TniB family NTP-binding protein [Pseudomonas sp. LP_7_YM]|uniref:TniB family NTP-binding protein n=1 Tax=Pseudomonas sp. LP_7_YM TaxID=2485137 RepID=UPI001060DFDB|nr:TniB family NTP-binding protein [Pseudomonas sp. LP_7_YM]TDV58891.1 TniB protein [Pseudomonas sp. LP_7_YM]
MTSITKYELIEHATFRQALDRLESTVERGLKGETLILPIFGPTRVGKSELIKTVLADNPPTVIEGVRHIPILRVMSPVNPTRRSLPIAVLEALKSPRYNRSSSEELTRMVCELLKITGTKIIFLDEMQHFAERGSQVATREAADWLKVLAEEMNLTLVLTGSPLANEVLLRNEQLRDRSEAVFDFRPYNWNHEGEQFEFRRALLSLTEAFTDAGWTAPDASDLDYGRRVYGACLGRIGMLVKLFRATEHLAKGRLITETTMARAYAEAVNTRFLEFNPFEGPPPVESLLGQGYARMLTEARLPMPKAAQRREQA